MKDTSKVLKTVGIFLLYFVYSLYLKGMLEAVGIPKIPSMFISDIIFGVIIVYLYRKNLKEDWEHLKKDYKVSKIIKTVFIWFIAIFVVNILMGAVTEMLFSNLATDDNTTALYNMSKVYTIFKALIFSTIAEELLFREAISDSIENSVALVLTSAVIYTAMNFVFSGIEGNFVWTDIIGYFIPALLFSLAYIKNNKNIILVMFIKFAYNLIPTILLFID